MHLVQFYLNANYVEVLTRTLAQCSLVTFCVCSVVQSSQLCLLGNY